MVLFNTQQQRLHTAGAAAVPVVVLCLSVVTMMLVPAQAMGAARASRTFASLGRLPMAVGLTNKQHVQFTVAIKDANCSALQQLGKQTFADRFRAAMRQDVVTYLKASGQDNAVANIKSAADKCFDLQVSSFLSASRADTRMQPVRDAFWPLEPTCVAENGASDTLHWWSSCGNSTV